MFEYPDLEVCFADMQRQSKLYQPSSFWNEAASKITNEILENGLERFRSLPTPLSFFVPTYGFPGNSFSQLQISSLNQYLGVELAAHSKPTKSLENFLSGYFSALSDYRVFLAADYQDLMPYLHKFSESSVGKPIEQWDFDQKKFSRSSLNYILGLVFLKQNIGLDTPKTILEIGGGFGSLGEIFKCSGINDLRYINLDIPPVNFVSQYYLGEIFGSENIAIYTQLRDADSIKIQDLPEISVLASWQIEKLVGNVDLFVNFISFQEMEPHIVQNYLDHVSRLNSKWVLLRNMREGKQVRHKNNSIGVEQPITSTDYLKMLPKYELWQRNVLPFGYRTVDGYHSELLLLRRKK